MGPLGDDFTGPGVTTVFVGWGGVGMLLQRPQPHTHTRSVQPWLPTPSERAKLPLLVATSGAPKLSDSLLLLLLPGSGFSSVRLVSAAAVCFWLTGLLRSPPPQQGG